MGKYLGQARTPLEGVALVHVELGRPATFDAHTVGVHACGMDTFVMLTIDTFSAVHTAMPTDQHMLVRLADDSHVRWLWKQSAK